eukprot:scaffold90285_cov47-Phaeocystis_antarctica.AAC.5
MGVGVGVGGGGEEGRGRGRSPAGLTRPRESASPVRASRPPRHSRAPPTSCSGGGWSKMRSSAETSISDQASLPTSEAAAGVEAALGFGLGLCSTTEVHGRGVLSGLASSAWRGRACSVSPLTVTRSVTQSTGLRRLRPATCCPSHGPGWKSGRLQPGAPHRRTAAPTSCSSSSP